MAGVPAGDPYTAAFSALGGAAAGGPSTAISGDAGGSSTGGVTFGGSTVTKGLDFNKPWVIAGVVAIAVLLLRK